jgi:1-acyl-sn-glycerol-3-phosphate acyltransferase
MPSPYPAAIPRRIVTITVVWLLAVLALVLLPVLAVGSIAVDLVGRRSGWPTVRMVGFFVAFLWIETTCELRVVWETALRPFRENRTLHDHHLEWWWLGRLMNAAERIVGLRVEVDEPDDLGPGPLLVFSQHVSIVDAVMPGVLLGTQRHWFVRYVLMRGLRYVPCMDIVGQRMPNHFIARGQADNTEGLATLRVLVRDMEDDELAVIFPGGGLFTPDVLHRAVEKLGERGSPQLPVAKGFRHVLPPRPSGVLAFFDGAPTANVLIFGHVGFEPVASIKKLWQVLPLRAPVEVKLWRHDRATVPEDDEGRLDWIYARWAEMDDWIDERKRARASA